MSYYQILGLNREPFSTSPDPGFFYDSQEHHAALIRLMIEIRLKRGLSLILGDVGTGKTTLSRKLYQMLKEREDIVFHMILDPTYKTEELFLESLIRTFNIEMTQESPTILDFKEAIKNYLFKVGASENKTVVLLIDEGQKLNDMSLESLRVFLNYETNEFKLLQVVLLAQMELLPRVREIKNLWDRVSLKYVLNPLDEEETKEMIEFRLKKAGSNTGGALFTDKAISRIYQYTQGYPRRISMLCHNALKELVVEQKAIVDDEVISKIISRDLK